MMTDTDELEAIREQRRNDLLDRAGTGSGEPDGTDEGTPSEPVHVEGPDHLDELTARHRVVLADFYADWCGPCQMLEPIVAELARESPAAVAKVDIDRHQGLAAELGIRGVPTLFLYVDGEPVKRLVGLQDGATLRDLIDQYA